MSSRRRSRRFPQAVGYSLLHPSMLTRQLGDKRPRKLRFIRRYVRDQNVDPKANAGLHRGPYSDSGRPLAYPHNIFFPNIGPVKQPAEITTVPNPIPDSGPDSVHAGSPLLGAIKYTSTFGLIVPSTPPSLPLLRKPLSSFTALSPLPFSIPTITSLLLIDTQGLSNPSSVPETTLSKSSTVNPQISVSKGHSVNLAVIILLTVGSSLLLLGSCILIKICTRPVKDKSSLSLPTFENADPEDDFFQSKESPIFGGKERLSSMPSSTQGPSPGWTWIQYPHVGLARSSIKAQRNSSGLQSESQYIQPESEQVVADTSSESGHLTTPHTLKRQSLGATSIYSPRSVVNVAQAITHDRLATANRDDILKQPKTRTSMGSQLFRGEKQRHRASVTSTIGLAYDGEYAASPSVVDPVDTPAMGHLEGKERIKSGYFANNTRNSNIHGAAYSIATATRVNVNQRNSFNKGKSVARNSWQSDRQALAYAVGLATPETNWMQSPHPTLYPDDSMSVVDTRKAKKRRSSRHLPESGTDIPVIIPDEPQTSGLMNMNFRVSQISLSQLALGETDSAAKRDHPNSGPRMQGMQTSSDTTSAQGSRRTDVPPRVPSPPPLPSLSQMALAQQNPEAYASYRSPTYSLYGLYESPRPDRRSAMR